MTKTQNQARLEQQNVDETRILEQDNIELLKQNSFLEDELHQLIKYDSRIDADPTYPGDFQPNTIHFSIENFQEDVDKDCVETVSSTTLVLGSSTVEQNPHPLSVVGAFDFEMQQPAAILDSNNSTSLSVMSSGSGADSIILNVGETVASLKGKLNRAQRGLLALTPKRVTLSYHLLEIAALQDDLEKSERIRRDNENALRTVRKELLTAQSKLLEMSDFSERNFNQYQDVCQIESAFFQFRAVIDEKEVERSECCANAPSLQSFINSNLSLTTYNSCAYVGNHQSFERHQRATERLLQARYC